MNAYTLYKRIKKCIDNDEIESVTFTKLKGNLAGEICIVSPPRRGIITIDPCKGDVLELFVHEMIHFLYPQAGETRIKKWAKWWMGASSWKSKSTLLKFLLKID